MMEMNRPSSQGTIKNLVPENATAHLDAYTHSTADLILDNPDDLSLGTPRSDVGFRSMNLPNFSADSKDHPSRPNQIATQPQSFAAYRERRASESTDQSHPWGHSGDLLFGPGRPHVDHQRATSDQAFREASAKNGLDLSPFVSSNGQQIGYARVGLHKKAMSHPDVLVASGMHRKSVQFNTPQQSDFNFELGQATERLMTQLTSTKPGFPRMIHPDGPARTSKQSPTNPPALSIPQTGGKKASSFANAKKHSTLPPGSSRSPLLKKKTSWRSKSSVYRGVSFNRKNGKWKSVLTVNCKQHFLGYFTSELEAARAYDKEAIKRRGDGASVNFPAVNHPSSPPVPPPHNASRQLAKSKSSPNITEDLKLETSSSVSHKKSKSQANFATASISSSSIATPFAYWSAPLAVKTEGPIAKYLPFDGQTPPILATSSSNSTLPSKMPSSSNHGPRYGANKLTNDKSPVLGKSKSYTPRMFGAATSPTSTSGNSIQIDYDENDMTMEEDSMSENLQPPSLPSSPISRVTHLNDLFNNDIHDDRQPTTTTSSSSSLTFWGSNPAPSTTQETKEKPEGAVEVRFEENNIPVNGVTNGLYRFDSSELKKPRFEKNDSGTSLMIPDSEGGMDVDDDDNYNYLVLETFDSLNGAD